MNPLIARAKNDVDQAELYWSRKRELTVRYENYRLQTITENDLSSVALRVIAEGRLGTTFGVTPDQDGLLESARAAASYGDPAPFSFAPAAEYPSVNAYDAATAELSSDDLVALCERIKTRIAAARPDIALIIHAEAKTSQLTVQTTEGADGESTSTTLRVGFAAPIKGAGIGISKSAGSISPFDVEDELIDEFLEWYAWTEATSTPATGRLPVILAPEAGFLLLLPLIAGLDGTALDRKTSPLVGKIGERILSEKLTVVDDAVRSGHVNARAFDDEGVPCRRRVLIDAGVLNGVLLDRRTGAALGEASTGNGRKKAMFGEGTEMAPNPWPVNPTVEPGDVPIRDLIADLDEGLLLINGMGFHSGNFPQGHFSVQAVGFHIRDGKVVGRLDKTMVAGNVYEDLLHVRAVSREQRGTHALSLLASGMSSPYILIDGLQVAGG